MVCPGTTHPASHTSVAGRIAHPEVSHSAAHSSGAGWIIYPTACCSVAHSCSAGYEEVVRLSCYLLLGHASPKTSPPVTKLPSASFQDTVLAKASHRLPIYWQAYSFELGLWDLALSSACFPNAHTLAF